MIATKHDNYSELLELARDMDCQEIIGAEISLKKYGNHLIGLCPFHNEKTPSFHVWRSNYKCFGCGAYGDAIQFIMDYNRFDGIYEAIECITGQSVVKPKKGTTRTLKLFSWEEAKEEMIFIDPILFYCLEEKFKDSILAIGNYLKALEEVPKNVRKSVDEFKKILQRTCA